MNGKETEALRNAWRMFRIMGEFADGFEALNDLPKGITIFGSARTPRDDPDYLAAEALGEAIGRRGFPVITGGGPGIMEAGNKGAYASGGTSIGLCIRLPHEQRGNPWITLPLDFKYFFVRKVMFLKHTAAVIVMPGGFGTLDEVLETLTLVQTDKMPPIPIILYKRAFWSGLIEWLREVVLGHGCISPGDFDLFQMVDTVDEAMAALAHLEPESVPLDEYGL